MLFIESYLDAALATLQANLPTALDVENAKHTDFTLPKPDSTLGYIWGLPDTGLIVSYPFVEVTAPDAQLGNFSLYMAVSDIRPTVMVRAGVQISEGITSPPQLYRASLRYGRALLNTLLAQNAFGDNSVVEQVRVAYRVSPGATPNQDETMTMNGYALLTFSLLGSEVTG